MKKAKKIIVFLLMAILMVGCTGMKKNANTIDDAFNYDKFYKLNKTITGETFELQLTGYKVVRDNEALPAVLIYYTFKNNSEEAMSANDTYLDISQASAMKDGDTYISQAYFEYASLTDSDNELIQNADKYVEQSETIDCIDGWKLRNNVNPVNLIFFDENDEVIDSVMIDVEKGLPAGTDHL
ncbi:DUF5067 domain-containing protein [Carnobacterium divergens]|uniref:DUF5067 domain-containing protein n=1 Tax=Carnobacterium divergens TaxID=2748 RepID=A0A7Z8D010_CARDV|nr:DUF5067 domain-containing protein [Carnobacterium divergens]TFI74378.1 DUF5067 domain-containing protein [Carnobacterium divergens]TFI78700.1 DUF5067 domain-containing protein [Carnobacterium divergens]TFI85259.1 DUF5067 domain-containing protein [Carnobacterium divergens]TFI97615.1 DUF5067 domain-containing protein [Carnobacterium divergens]TFJ13875.1 DUF5067 domain-containing protein [Carnobacterium divergens]